MTATIIITAIVAAFFAFIILHLIFGGGRSGGTDSTQFPYDTGSFIAPPSWSPDSGSSTAPDAQCEISDGGWSDGGSDFGSCDSGSSNSD